MSIAVGSLSSKDQRALEDLNLLPDDLNDDMLDADVFNSSAATPSLKTMSSANTSSSREMLAPSRTFRRGTAGGIPWFEEMVEGSHLGRLMRAKRGMGISDDNSTSFEWEISEWHSDGSIGIPQDDSEENGSGKRKREHQANVESRQKRA